MRRYSPLVLLLIPCFLLPLFAAEPAKVKPTPPEGVLPVGADGKPLNLDFETGTLKDWKAEGEAFAGQPIRGDTVARRRGDMKSQHQGQYWIGGYERKGDRPQGTLTSVPFKVTHPWASFLVGGGPWPETCVQIVRKDTGKVFSQTSGLEEENLRRVAVDLRAHLGKEIFIRLVDKHSGHWGHLNFDDFRFHSSKPNIPPRKPQAAPPDVYKYAGLPPEKAAQAMTVPEGFSVTLFAGEPDVRQPIAMCLDDRGRLWVAEAYCYPQRRADRDARDRIVIFEDTDGDGKFDRRTVFMEGLNLVSGLEVGFGGVWIGAAPYLMFVPIKAGEDKPAGKPRILLDGWHYEDTHETLNTFCWGPDGWLYGCHGVFTYSRVGKPGTPDEERIPINAGIWRYHPTRHVFEVFAHGTSNPWGLDFDVYGQAFIEACVIPHAFHIIQGGRYQRQAGTHFNPHTYADIQTIADHLHWQGANPWAGNYSSSSTGGGHAHCGLMIYQGGAWPEEYRGKMFMGNVHGHRLNMDVLHRKGSGFIASHGPDFLLANDAWARFINFRYGPDGNVYLLDWYDKQACHLPNVNIWDRSNGRIYKVSYRGTKPVRADLARLSDRELVALQGHKNEWFVRHARRLLQERAANRTLGADTQERLAALAFGQEKETLRLRGLWALHVTGGLIGERLLKGLSDRSAYVRAWTVQFAAEEGKPSRKVVARLAQMAREDKSRIVRLYLASAAQRLSDTCGADLVAEPGSLPSHEEDASDPNLPLTYWYALEAQVTRWEKTDLARVGRLFSSTRLPLLREFLVRRVVSIGTNEAILLPLGLLAEDKANPAERKMILRNILAGLKGRRQVPRPAQWDELVQKAKLFTAKDAELRSLAYSIAVVFGDARAFKQLREELADRGADLAQRRSALTALLDAHDRELAPILHRLVGEKALRGDAILGLASYDHPKTPAVLLGAFRSLTLQEKRHALNTLSSRAAYGKALMEAVAKKTVPASEIPAEVVRQLRNLNDKTLDRRIGEVWGIVRTTPADRARLIAQWRKKMLAPAPPPDLPHGRALFAKVCQQCHTLYGVGGKVGPDITGSNRANLDYLLENILDPSAVIPNDYKATVIDLKKGRVVTGIIRGETATALTVVTANETLTIPLTDIEKRTPSNTSMMPDDLLKPLSDAEVRELFAYLRHPTQVPILATPDNARDLFNGTDLTGWDGDAKLWKVEKGEIVGKSPGIKKNEFLKSQMIATDFRLTLQVKLVPNRENSGVQFRSEVLPDGDVKGPQADVGAGWWGKLYEEHGRGVLWNRSGEKYVKVGDWNRYEIVARGSRVKTFINGKLCVDVDDPQIARRGIFALQIHSGGPMEVRFKDLKLEVLTGKERPEKK
jgi:putative membrane-bound dehydrogenase-like protein